MRKKIIFLLPFLLLMISVVFNVYLYFYSIRIYCQQKKSQIDPSNSFQYHELNKRIGNKKGNVTRIVLFGDSRIYQWDPLPELADCEFINRGISGEMTSQSLLRINNDVISLKPDIVIIEIGINDCNSIGALPNLENLIITNCKNNIIKIIEILKMNKIKSIFLTIFPVGSVYPYRFLVWSNKTRDAINEINEIILKYNSKNIKIINCDTIFLKEKRLKKDFANDMLHLNHSGYVRLNDYIKPYLEKLVKETNFRN